METLYFSKKDLDILEEIFNENYLIIKRVKELEGKIYDIKIRTLFKKIRETHDKNLITILKLLDGKERFI
jgi:hypothetical protein